MNKVLIFIAEGFEEIEGLTVVDLLRRADIPIETVSITKDNRVTGSHGITIMTDLVIDDADFENTSMLVLPGGMPGTKNLEECGFLMEKLDAFKAAIDNGEDKYIAAICAAPTIFAHRGYLNGKNACCYPSREPELTEGGALVSKDKAVRDGRTITSRGFGTAIAFGLEIIRTFKGDDAANKMAESIVY